MDMKYDRIMEIDNPASIKDLNYDELAKLAYELREYLIDIVSKNGGHLASNLGVVELTLAIHKVFSSPKDKIIWDVGHQAYVHKLLTGRAEQFKTLRKYNGISGFPKRSESDHDVFNTGHSSTSISAAVGFSQARDLKGKDNNVIAVIGDGALTAGMAFEALNYAGHMKNNLIVILNDNEMSISHNIGALSSYLTRIRIDPTYSRLKDDVETILKNIPAIGKSLAKTAERAKGSLKYLLVPGMLFEELGFKYFGPIDGHNIPQTVYTLNMAQKVSGPKLIHVITKKGKGYLYAEKTPDRFHGVGKFDKKTGKAIKSQKSLSYSEVFGDTLCALSKKNSKLIAITAAMPDGTGLKKFAQQYPNRFFDVGIAEQNAVTMAAGMAAEGFIPVVAIYSTFLQRAYDQIIHDVCLQNFHVIFAIDRAGLVGEDGETHHGAFDISYLRPIPNITIMAPKDEHELSGMLKTAISLSNPVAIRYPRGTGIGINSINKAEWPYIKVGKGEKLIKGKDINILAVGSTVYPALKASEILKSDYNILAGVVNIRFIKPLDDELLKEIYADSKLMVTVEENAIQGGFGSAILEFFEQEKIHDVKLARLGIPDTFINHGTREQLLDNIGISPNKIVASVLSLLRGEGYETKKDET